LTGSQQVPPIAIESSVLTFASLMPPQGPSNVDAQGDRHSVSQTQQSSHDFVAHGLLAQG
jgi:hypothetical protein